MCENCLVSICIPCYKRTELVRRTLQSIYVDNAEVSTNLYEVVITDNDPEQELAALAEDYAEKPNFLYKPTKCEGFMNSYFALSNGNGALLKLHNSQNRIIPGMLKEIVEEARVYQQEKPLIFQSNGFLENFDVCEYDNFNIFMKDLSYWSSWSGGMTIWKNDFDNIKSLEINPLFPHTSVFFTQYAKNKFVIDDRILYDVQRVTKRGGHNKFEAFTIYYPSLVDRLYQDGHISTDCKDKIFKALYQQYIPTLLFNKYIARIEVFESHNFKSNCQKFFPNRSYWIAWFNILFVPFIMLKRRFRRMYH